jgi:hypothetical protein
MPRSKSRGAPELIAGTAISASGAITPEPAAERALRQFWQERAGARRPERTRRPGLAAADGLVAPRAGAANAGPDVRR